MKTIKKECQVVLLLTDKVFKHPCFVSGIDANKMIRWTNLKMAADTLSWVQYHHAYILSDEEIKEGVWVYNNPNNEIYYVTDKVFKNQWLNKDCKKIIATTNPELTIFLPHDVIVPTELPKPIGEFIQQWIDKGCPDKINVDYWIIPFSKVAPDRDRTGEPKLAVSENNTIRCSFIENNVKKITKI